MIRLLILGLFVAVCQGKIKSFSVSKLGKVTSIWLVEGNYVVLECEIDDESSTMEIKRLQDGAIVNTSRAGEKSLRHVIYGVSCSDIGTYECIRDHVEQQTADLVIMHCPLQPCDGVGVQRTIFVNDKEKINLSLCVLACGNIEESFAKFNGSIVRRKNNSSSWYWDYEKLESGNLPTIRFHVHVHGHVKFGLLSIRILSHYGQQYYLNFDITLRPAGPPDCPTEVNIRDRGLGSVELSWKPGQDGGAKQYYAVYYSKDGVDWSIQRDGIEQTSGNLTELDSNTAYYFRVVSRNQHSGQVDASTCNNTVFLLTSESVAKSDDVYDTTRADILVPILCVCSILVLLIFLSAILCWRRKVNGKRLNNASQRNEKSPMVTTQNNRSTSPGDYVSDDGLKYISVYPVDQKRKEKRKRRERETKVQYATLDFIKTEKLRQHAVAL